MLGEMRVPRWLHTSQGDLRVELHGFADASERAYAAAVYARSRSDEIGGEPLLLTAKTKVAPIRQVSLPRLELCAAALLTKLVSHVQKTMALADAPTHLWSDSTLRGFEVTHPSGKPSWRTESPTSSGRCRTHVGITFRARTIQRTARHEGSHPRSC